MDSFEKEIKSHNIQKSLNIIINSGELNRIIKANTKSDSYADTKMNREKGIVGMPYKAEMSHEENDEGKEDEKEEEKKED